MELPPLVHLTPLDPRYPSRLRGFARAPASMTVRGGSLEAGRVVAIVGSRKCRPDARRFARRLAAGLARAGVVVASGGASGVDGEAHLAALAAGGRTWVVAGTGCEHVFPKTHAALFDAVALSPGAMLWPFAPDYEARAGFKLRNRVLVALADAVVVVQADLHSGALHAAACARTLGRPLWVMPAPPWQLGFEGSRKLLDEGARPLTSVSGFVALTSRGPGPAGRPAAPSRPLSAVESAIYQAISSEPLHLDHLADRARLPAQAAAAALLTLSLENVVVEGPPGFFSRRDAP